MGKVERWPGTEKTFNVEECLTGGTAVPLAPMPAPGAADLIRDTGVRHPEHDQVVAWRVDHPAHTEWYITARPTANTGDARETGSTGSQGGPARSSSARWQRSWQRTRFRSCGRGSSGGANRATSSWNGVRRRCRRVGIEADWPVTTVEGRPASGAELGGVQVWGMTPRADEGARVETVEWQGRKVGANRSAPAFASWFSPPSTAMRTRAATRRRNRRG